jgi:hypothetical protein
VDTGEWDGSAGTSEWLHPDERIYWRGRPDPSVIFSPQDLYLIPFSVLWSGFFVFSEYSGVRDGWSFNAFFTIPFLLVGAYIVIGRFGVKVWIRHRSYYAVTNLRAVEVKKAGRVVREATPSVRVDVRPRRDGQRGSMVFARSPGLNQTDWRWGRFGVPESLASHLREASWP